MCVKRQAEQFFQGPKEGALSSKSTKRFKSDGTSAKRLAKDVVLDDHKGPAWGPDSQTIFYVKRDFKKANPIMWTHIQNGKSGILMKETQMNSDLSAYHKQDGTILLAYRSVGLQGSSKKTWHRIYAISFNLNDLK